MSDSNAGLGTQPTEDRERLAHAIKSSAPLDLAAEGIAAATEFTPLLVYVERRGDRYRWSPAHRGGPYPLMRVTARFLQMDHQGLVLPFRTLTNETPAGFGQDGIWEGVCIVRGSEDDQGPPDAWTVLEFDAAQTAADVKVMLAAKLH
jgi:hypothetical protein